MLHIRSDIASAYFTKLRTYTSYFLRTPPTLLENVRVRLETFSGTYLSIHGFTLTSLYSTNVLKGWI